MLPTKPNIKLLQILVFMFSLLFASMKLPSSGRVLSCQPGILPCPAGILAKLPNGSRSQE
jgi:hypothetical protein